MLSLPSQAATLFCLTFLVTGLRLLLPSAAERRQLLHPTMSLQPTLQQNKKRLPRLVSYQTGICFCFSADNLFAFWPLPCTGGMGLCIQRAGPWVEHQEIEELLFLIRLFQSHDLFDTQQSLITQRLWEVKYLTLLWCLNCSLIALFVSQEAVYLFHILNE